MFAMPTMSYLSLFTLKCAIFEFLNLTFTNLYMHHMYKENDEIFTFTLQIGKCSSFTFT